MRIIFMGRKKSALEVFHWLVDRGHEVLPVVPKRPEPSWADRPTYVEGLLSGGLEVYKQVEILKTLKGERDSGARRFLDDGVDMVISYLFPERVRPPLLESPTLGAVNFHPAPLPEYGGMAGYNQAILEGADRYGATAHYMVDEFDAGSIIECEYFEIDAARETAYSLERKTALAMADLFRRVVSRFETEGRLPAREQENRSYVTKKEFQAMRRVDLQKDSPEEIERKARAFWYPPLHGAAIEVGGKEFTLVSEEMLKEIGGVYRNKNE